MIKTALIREDMDDTMPPQLIAIHEITQLSRNYTNRPSEAGQNALLELIGRLKKEKEYLENPNENPDFYHGGIHLLMMLYGSFDIRVKDVVANVGHAEKFRQYSLFCSDWIARLSAWLDNKERLTETANRVRSAHVFLEGWYQMESGRLTPDNRGHPRDLAEAGISMPALEHDGKLEKWVPVK